MTELKKDFKIKEKIIISENNWTERCTTANKFKKNAVSERGSENEKNKNLKWIKRSYKMVLAKYGKKEKSDLIGRNKSLQRRKSKQGNRTSNKH